MALAGNIYNITICDDYRMGDPENIRLSIKKPCDLALRCPNFRGAVDGRNKRGKIKIFDT